jgi:nicotinamidase-related amidase
MKANIGFFDVDCCEANEDFTRLQFRPRVEPVAAKIRRLHALAGDRDIAMIFTTCCSGRMLQAGTLPDILYVPCDPCNDGWRDRVSDHRLFFLQKFTCNIPGENFRQQAFDAFRHNGNASTLLDLLGIKRWVVFGNGFDLCVRSASLGILKSGRAVHLLTDVTVPSDRGYGQCGTEENHQQVIAELVRLGATTGTLEELLASPLLC